MNFSTYLHVQKLAFSGGINVLSDTFKIALVTSDYAFSNTHTQWSHASFAEVATGNGYTTGGASVVGFSVDDDKIDCSDVSWTSLTKTFNGAVLRKVGTVGSLVDPLIGYFNFNEGANIVVADATFNILINANGLLTLG